MEALLTQLGTWVVELISSLGYLGVFLAMTMESACIPLPSEIILPFAGYLVARGDFSLGGAVLAATLGNLMGGMLAYWVGAHGGRPFLNRYGKYILIKEKELAWTERLFERHGEITVLVGRILPIVRTFISLPAGIAGMNGAKMALYTVIGALPWCFLLIGAGERLGEHWDSLKPFFHNLNYVVAGMILILVAGWLWHRKKRK